MRHTIAATACVLAWGLGGFATSARAANVGNRPQLGEQYYVIINTDLDEPLAPGAFILRGKTGKAGIAHDRLILAPNTNYQEWILNPRTMRVAVSDYRSATSGNRFVIPDFRFTTTSSPDSDGDGLHDLGEFIVGTDKNNPDSDGDGIKDGTEVRNGINPLDGRPAAVGIVAAQDTTGRAWDVAATSGLAAIADGTSGVVVFSVTNPLQPVRVAQLDTAGDARAVAFGFRLLAVADGAGGLVVVDTSDPADIHISQQIPLGASVTSVAADGAVGYAGLANGEIVSVDLRSGVVLERKKLSNAAVQDLVLGHEALYVQVVGTLYTVDLADGDLGDVVSLAASGSVGAGGRRLRLAFGGDRLYGTFTSGVNVFSLSNPLAPTLIRSNTTTLFGWKQLVPNGTGLALAAVDTNSTDDGAHDVSVYQLNPDGSFVVGTVIQTPGLASAVAIYNGLGFIADGNSGLQIANYLAYDSLGVPPTIALSASFPLGASPQAEEGKIVRVSAAVTDDVQVRNVEFYVDGARVSSDGGFPFEARFVTPVITASKTSFTLQARAFDTGGNRVDSPLYSVALVPDATPPRVKRVVPADNGYRGEVLSVLVFFSEPLRLATVTPSAVIVRPAGPDGVFGSGDDPALPLGVVSFRSDINAIQVEYPDTLPLGKYRVEAKSTLEDLAGNALAAEFQSTFTVLGFVDQDQDGVADVLELALGLDPTKPDSDGDGILDGLEDSDGDGLSNALEALYGTDLGDKDTDFDNLADGAEIGSSTSPTNPDTDGDGWSDGEEVRDGSNPALASSTPSLPVIARPTVAIENLAAEEGIASPVGAVVVRPAIAVDNLAAEEGEAAPQGAVISRPAVAVDNLAAEEAETAPVGAVISRPSVAIDNLAAEEGQAAPQGAVISRPPAAVSLPAN